MFVLKKQFIFLQGMRRNSNWGRLNAIEYPDSIYCHGNLLYFDPGASLKCHKMFFLHFLMCFYFTKSWKPLGLPAFMAWLYGCNGLSQGSDFN